MSSGSSESAPTHRVFDLLEIFVVETLEKGSDIAVTFLTWSCNQSGGKVARIRQWVLCLGKLLSILLTDGHVRAEHRRRVKVSAFERQTNTTCTGHTYTTP
jgi:hypothetical protein